MIIARSPLRITLGGGGTDLASYYADHEGFVVAAAIDKYVYVTVMRPFSPGIYLKYSALEHVDTVGEIKHPIIREALAQHHPEPPQIEITTLADIPAGTGLGSSGSFTTALLKALYAHQRKSAHARELAENACDIEIERLQNPVGKQDQFISAFGGLICLTFHKDHRVSVEPLRVSREAMFELEDNLLLFFTGYSRAAGAILQDQQVRTGRVETGPVGRLALGGHVQAGPAKTSAGPGGRDPRLAQDAVGVAQPQFRHPPMLGVRGLVEAGPALLQREHQRALQ